jgi:uncharacterized protein YlxW (UPF0749 family)
LAKARQRLATTLDSLREAQQANRYLQAEVTECNATIACMQADHERQNIAILNLIKRLNAANVRCAEMQGTLDSRGVTVNAAYFLAALGDGSIAGPFSRN